jgi:hypothetical protein
MNTNKRFLGVILLMTALLLIVTDLAACQPGAMDNPALLGTVEAGETLRIMPLGDSITEGFCDKPSSCNWPEEIKVPLDGFGNEACKEATNYDNPEEKSYRAVLKDKLVAKGINMTYVGSVSVVKGLAHEGHSGFTLFDIDYCIKMWVGLIRLSRTLSCFTLVQTMLCEAMDRKK